jgi:RNA polymerase sigma factor (sigma-70 family)
MHDSEVVASFVGDRSGELTEAYDKYADPIYKYCLTWLGEPSEAADAVQDTFVIAAARAAARLVDLREPDRLRAWLYAVARNECQRITPPGRPVFATAQAPEVTADAADGREDAERARLLDAATRGLTPGEREVIELGLRHGLDVAEVAAVVGVSRSQASTLASRARKHLEASLGAVVVARAGRRDYCYWLGRTLADWDGQLTVPLRKQLHRHIGGCPACSTRRDLELHPDQSRGDALTAAAAAGLRVAAGPPDALRAQTLALAAGQDPDAIAHRAAILGRVGEFDSRGFPKPVPGPKEAPARGDEDGPTRRRGRVAVAAGLAAAAVIGVVAFALVDGPGHQKQAGGQASGSAPTAGPSAAAPLVASPGTSAASPATRTAAKATATPKNTGSATTAPQGTPTAAHGATAPAAPPSATPSRTATGTAPTPTAKAAPGTLAVSPSGGTLGVPPGGTTILLTAQGGPVTWSSTVSSGLGTVQLSPSSGTINAGATVTLTVTASGLASGRKVAINPDGNVFTIFVEL